MIPLNLDDPTVLRRTLEEIQSQLITTSPIAHVEKMLAVPTPTRDEITVKINELIGVVNSMSALINGVQSSELS